jgi:hypothetical protein
MHKDIVRAHYVVFDRGNEGKLAEDSSAVSNGDHAVPAGDSWRSSRAAAQSGNEMGEDG